MTQIVWAKRGSTSPPFKKEEDPLAWLKSWPESRREVATHQISRPTRFQEQGSQVGDS